MTNVISHLQEHLHTLFVFVSMHVRVCVCIKRPSDEEQCECVCVSVCDTPNVMMNAAETLAHQIISHAEHRMSKIISCRDNKLMLSP